MVLEIDVYGRQDILDPALAEGVAIEWSVDRGTEALIEADPPDRIGTSVVFVAPEIAGRYLVKAAIADASCLSARDEETERAAEIRCQAEFEITVLRRISRTVDPTRVPVNPAGAIPIVISGADGVQHAVFTPEDGGSATSPLEECTLDVPSGSVQNREIIGAALDSTEVDAGFSDHRYAARGAACTVSVVDSEGAAISSYFLAQPAEICIPLPPVFRSRITDVQIASIRADTVHQILGSVVRILGNTGEVALCGDVSLLPRRWPR